MNTQQMRNLCWEAYSGKQWHLKVDKMPDDQIVGLVKQKRIGVSHPKPKTEPINVTYAKTYYKTCSFCGANLDPNEKCDCLRR